MRDPDIQSSIFVELDLGEWQPAMLGGSPALRKGDVFLVQKPQNRWQARYRSNRCQAYTVQHESPEGALRELQGLLDEFTKNMNEL